MKELRLGLGLGLYMRVIGVVVVERVFVICSAHHTLVERHHVQFCDDVMNL